ncbi:MAG: ABC transporter ATP-binding protein, partial [Gammaproteobacteria bacterium]
MALVTLRRITHGFGGPPLLEGIDMSIAAGERVCLVGRNGSGKSTLLKIIAGSIRPDEGEIARRQELRVAELGQEVPDTLGGTVYDV